jgi:hyperosmotically inducible periplasmic protein
MGNSVRSLAIVLCLGFGAGLGTVGCLSTTGKTAGQNVDDATITAQVKSKLAGERLATLTRIDVDTNKGTVYLNGNVDNEASKDRAAQVASQVTGVKSVINNLKVQAGS